VEPDEQDWRDFYEERAAILEYEAGFSRQDAERLALAETIKRRREANRG